MDIGSNYKNIEDAQLMQLSAKGDEKAFSELYMRYSAKLMRFFFKMLWKDREKAEDFTQDIFSKIIQKPELYNPQMKFSTWIYSIANNMCKNEYRKQSVRKEVHEKISFSQNGHVQARNEYDKNLIKSELSKAVDELDEKHKTVFIMKYKQHLSIREIAEIIDISEGTVKSRLFYSLKKLSEKLSFFKPEKIFQS
ncbi:MAG: RNA polymerase sigma factor [Bacteroidota bacterium]